MDKEETKGPSAYRAIISNLLALKRQTADSREAHAVENIVVNLMALSTDSRPIDAAGPAVVSGAISVTGLSGSIA